MNPREQRSHRTVTATIANNLNDVAHETARQLTALDRRLSDEGKALRSQISEERTHRLKLADEQRAYVDARDREEREIRQAAVEHLLEAIVALRDRGFWGRLRWLFIGR